jgi:hypothetical protein
VLPKFNEVGGYEKIGDTGINAKYVINWEDNETHRAF